MKVEEGKVTLVVFLRAANFANVINANAEKENVEIKQEAKRRIQGDQEELGFFFLFKKHSKSQNLINVEF